MKNHIYIIGAGAIGKSLAVFLKLENKNVTLIRGSLDNQNSYIEKIKVLLPDNTTCEAAVEISTLSNFSSLKGLILLTNKSFGNPQLAETLKAKANGSPIILLQNGLGIEQAFVEQYYPELYRCVLFVTSQNISTDTVSFKPISASPIGIVRQKDANLEQIIGQLNNSKFPFKADDNIELVVWKKAIINCAFNSICPLLDIDNGVFQRNSAALAIATSVIAECVAIAHLKGISLSVEEIKQNLLNISNSSDGQLISTLQDIKNGRKTEIETLNLEIVKIANTLNQAHLVQQTKLLGELTYIKADLYSKK